MFRATECDVSPRRMSYATAGTWSAFGSQTRLYAESERDDAWPVTVVPADGSPSAFPLPSFATRKYVHEVEPEPAPLSINGAGTLPYASAWTDEDSSAGTPILPALCRVTRASGIAPMPANPITCWKNRLLDGT